jgi:hypothetical protein
VVEIVHLYSSPSDRVSYFETDHKKREGAMLKLVHETRNKRAAQAVLERNIKAALKGQGTLNIGFPGGNADEKVYSAGQGKLWVAFGKPSNDSAVPRYWNAFGVYKPDRPAQTITVEINKETGT